MSSATPRNSSSENLLNITRKKSKSHSLSSSSSSSTKRKKTIKISNLVLTIRSFETNTNLLKKIKFNEIKKKGYIQSHHGNENWIEKLNHFFTSLKHPNICDVIDIIEGKCYNVYIVSYLYRTSISDEIQYCKRQNKRVNDTRIYQVSSQIFNAMYMIHQFRMFIGFLKPNSFCLDNNGSCKLTHVAYYYLLNQSEYKMMNGNTFDLIQYVPYLAPEIFYAYKKGFNVNQYMSAQCDMWSIGIILLEYILCSKLPIQWDKILEEKDQVAKLQHSEQRNHDSNQHHYILMKKCLLIYKELNDFILFCCENFYKSDNGSIFSPIAEYNQAWERLSKLDPSLVDVILKCLSFESNERPTMLNMNNWILEQDFFKLSKEKKASAYFRVVETMDFISSQSPKEKISTIIQADSEEQLGKSYKAWKSYWISKHMDISYWLMNREELKFFSSSGIYLPPFQIPIVKLLNEKCDIYQGQEVCKNEKQNMEKRENLVTIPSNILNEWCTQNIGGHYLEDHFSLKQNISANKNFSSSISSIQNNYSSLSAITGDLMGSKRFSTYPNSSFSNLLIPKDRNVGYQKQRVQIFRKLLLDYPNSRLEIIKEAKVDIPPVLRGEIWAAILNVEDDIQAQEVYDSIDKESKTSCDRQISVDVPRCHQYNKMLSSKEGHNKLTLILKAWVKYHVNLDLVYWQGLDSLLAPFLVLNFYHEARAFCCLRSLVNKFVKKFFAADNSHAMEERLICFHKLLMYHDSELGLHMTRINFCPELYAIPWFLTLFAHVLPIEKVFVLWDAILLGESQYLPLFVGVAFLKQMHSALISSDFNTAISMLTNMQGIDIRKAIEDAEQIRLKTPSCIFDVSEASFIVFDPESNVSNGITLTQYRELVFPRISASDFREKLQDIAIILDIRPTSSFKQDHLPSAHHFGVNDEEIQLFEKNLQERENHKVEEVDGFQILPGKSSDQIQRENEEKQWNFLENQIKILKEKVTSFLKYKRGLPVVIIPDDLDSDEVHTHCKNYNQAIPKQKKKMEESFVDLPNYLLHIEMLLALEGVPYVSVVSGGMKAISECAKKKQIVRK